MCSRNFCLSVGRDQGVRLRVVVREGGCQGVDWINVAQNRVSWQVFFMRTVMNLRNSIKGGAFLDHQSFARKT